MPSQDRALNDASRLAHATLTGASRSAAAAPLSPFSDEAKGRLVTLSEEAYVFGRGQFDEAQRLIDAHYADLLSALRIERAKAEGLTRENASLRRQLETLEGELASVAARGGYR